MFYIGYFVLINNYFLLSYMTTFGKTKNLLELLKNYLLLKNIKILKENKISSLISFRDSENIYFEYNFFKIISRIELKFFLSYVILNIYIYIINIW